VSQTKHLAELSVIAAISLCVAVAQQATAPKDLYHYPAGYSGKTFTGEVLHAEDSQLMLEYKGGAGSEIFIGTIEAPCMAHLKSDPRQLKELRLSTIPNRTLLTAFYNPRTNSQTRAKQNLILAVRFDRWKGRDFTNPRRPLIPCSKAASHK